MVDFQEIILQGIVARRLSENWDNPFYKAEATPTATGQSLRDWSCQATAWETGWGLQDAIDQGRKCERIFGSLREAA